MFNQDLPSLPIPSLKETEQTLLKWIKPLVSTAQFQETVQKATEFFSQTGEGPKLQQQLLTWQKTHQGSWLKPLWDDMYLRFRGSLPLEMNFSILLNKPDFIQPRSKASCAGRIGFLLGKRYHEIIDHEVTPEMISGTPLCMSQYKNLFKSTRIPRETKDTYQIGTFTKKNNHIVVAYRNHFYKILVSNANGSLLSPSAIQSAVQQIIDNNPTRGQNIGIFTAVNRPTAAKVYTTIQASKTNRESMRSIHDALALLIIDEEETNNTLEDVFSKSMSRYFDKTIEIILAENGEIGFNFEHFGVDGTTGAMLIQYIQENLQEEFTGQATHPTRYELLQWELTPKLQQQLQQLEIKYEEKKARYTSSLKQFNDFGAEKIKTFRISPDAFFHIALQLAQYRTFQSFKSTYEPVAVRFFKDGRTESARAISEEKTNFVYLIEQQEKDEQILYDAMKEASDAHSNRLKKAQQGYGVERHLFGLQKMAEQNNPNDLPALFQDEGFQTLTYDFFSTSGLVLPNMKGWIFGPVVEDGYGISYSIAANDISFNMTSQKENQQNVELLTDNLIEAMKEMRRIIETVQAK